MIDYHGLARSILAGASLREDEALAILDTPDAQLLDLVAAAGLIRRAHFGNRVKLNYLVNLKSGLCQENCSYCSQALGATAPILKYSWLSAEEAVEQARAGIGGGASRVCLVASGRGPMNRDIDRVTDIVSTLKEEHPGVEVCACLGILRDGQAERLESAGVDAYNHNINTAESHHDRIVQTHTYQDRIRTIGKAKQASLSPCSGLIVGMGESSAQIVEAVFALRELDVDSIPVNFLIPFDGTPMQGRWDLTPAQCLRIVALVRFACPATEVRLAGGRELHLRSLQPLALHAANSIFLGDYLTSQGEAAAEDLAMIRDNGFVPQEPQVQEPLVQEPLVSPPHAPVVVRRRGAGTAAAPNA
ncbi:biotin synthase BioB [Microbacterium sp. YJN-G]|uniref:biotin synthase BioB n=1 Tax=Microbacterium sp. YJN-G TaxID=2763257 RepID=UPI001D0C70AF|nr:biotin synthase BioB [Microbacterium sp. YJN-G]